LLDGWAMSSMRSRDPEGLDGDQLGTVSRLWLLIRGSRLLAIWQSLASIFEGILEGATLALFAQLGLEFAGSIDGETKWFWTSLSTSTAALLLFGTISLRLGVGVSRAGASALLRARVTRRLRRAHLESYALAKWEIKDSLPAGLLQQVIVGYPPKVVGHIGALLGYLGNFFSLVTLLVIAFSLDARLSTIMLLSIVLLTASIYPIRLWVQRQTSRRLAHEQFLSTKVAELRTSSETLATFGVDSVAIQSARTSSDKEISFGARVNAVSSSMVPLYSASTYGFLGLGLFLVAQFNSANLATMAPVFLVVLRALLYAQGLQGTFLTLANLTPLLDSMFQTSGRLTASIPEVGDVPLDRFEGMTLSDVRFRYLGADEDALTVKHLSIQRGDRIYIEGPSGSGKSTLGRILLNLVNPSLGTIMVNGIDRSRISRKSWHKLVAAAPQVPQLIDGTVFDNVRYYRDGISDEEVERALEMANLLSEVMALPDGLNTKIGGSTGLLSGGQRQRLGLARAFASDPEFILLDEPTSAIDKNSEEAVIRAIAALPREKTVVIVSHSESMAASCTRRVRVSNGVALAER